MANFDIAIDLGTSSVVININGKTVLNEPSVIAINNVTQQIVAVGQRAYQMIGKTPDNITATSPIANGVISDYKLNEMMIQELLNKVSKTMMVKPRVMVCVHSLITDVERRAVVDAAVAAGARKVYLIEEPIAVALGSGIDIKQPNGQMVINIGGGTTDVAVLSLNGVVVSKAVKIGGSNFDDAIMKNILKNHKLHIGKLMAESIKMKIGTAINAKKNIMFQVKGRNALNGLPQMIDVSQYEIYEAISDCLEGILNIIYDVLEVTPPELIGDVSTNGILLSGGGALFKGLEELISNKMGITTTLVEEPITCVAKGTSLAFDLIEDFQDGFLNVAAYKH